MGGGDGVLVFLAGVAGGGVVTGEVWIEEAGVVRCLRGAVAALAEGAAVTAAGEVRAAADAAAEGARLLGRGDAGTAALDLSMGLFQMSVGARHLAGVELLAFGDGGALGWFSAGCFRAVLGARALGALGWGDFEGGVILNVEFLRVGKLRFLEGRG